MEVVSIRELQIYKLVKPFVFADVTSRVMPEPYKRGDFSYRNTAVAEIDFNNDGKFDLYVARADRRLVTQKKRRHPSGTTNDILLQNRNGRYVDVSEEAGIPKRTNSMGVTAGDFNNDGYTDLLVMQWSEPEILLLNRGDGTFERVNRLIPKSRKTRGDNAVAVDYDLDGRLVRTNKKNRMLAVIGFPHRVSAVCRNTITWLYPWKDILLTSHCSNDLHLYRMRLLGTVQRVALEARTC